MAEAFETETPIKEETEVPADEIKPVFAIAEWNKIVCIIVACVT